MIIVHGKSVGGILILCHTVHLSIIYGVLHVCVTEVKSAFGLLNIIINAVYLVVLCKNEHLSNYIFSLTVQILYMLQKQQKLVSLISSSCSLLQTSA